MISRLIALISMVMFVCAQSPAVSAGVAQNPSTLGASAPVPAVQPAAHTVTVPAGTAIQLTLINPIRSRTSKPGDAIRASVAFPVAVGTEVAIPAGSYAEGTLQQVTPRSRTSGQPQVKIQFTRLLFSNGYSVPLSAENTQAELDRPAPSPPAPIAEGAAAAPVAQPRLVDTAYGAGGPQQTTAPSLPPVGPSPAVVTGAVLGGGAALTVGALLWARHRAASLDYVLFDAGWQFQITLQQPLSIDTARLPVPVSASPAQ